ncbi:MAG: polyamine aminopropyltransferase [Planifilum sp.]|jgi:spermidine synthase
MEKEQYGQGYVRREDGWWLSDTEEEYGFQVQWKVKSLLHREKSDFQEISVIETEGFGRALVLDGIVQTTERDGWIYNEMITHIPLAAHPNPSAVCIIGGGDCGAVRETVKYPAVKRVDMVEIDPRVVSVCRSFLPSIAGEGEPDPRIHFLYEDGAAFVKEKKGEYDVIIVDSSDPVGPAKVLFEEPFYRDVHRALKDDGIMVCQSESPVFHPRVLTKVRDTLKTLFPDVRTYLATIPTYPGGIWSFTLASKRTDPLDGIEERLRDKDTRYVNRDIVRSSFRLPNYVRELLGE